MQLRQDAHRAQELIQRAISLDPRFVEARRLLATTYMVRIIVGDSNDRGLFYLADEELRRAIRDDPSRLDLRAALAGVAITQGDMQRGGPT